MRFETSVVLFALGALTGASNLEDSQLAHMTANPSIHPEFLINQQNSAICKEAVDRIRDRSQNQDPNVAIRNSSKNNPYQDNSFSGWESFYWPNMPISDMSQSLVDQLRKSKFYSISDKFEPYTYSMWGSYGLQHTDPIMGGLNDCSLMMAAQIVAQWKPDHLHSLFITKDLNEPGVNTVKLYQMGIPVTVTVDDQLPFEQNSNGQYDKLMFAQASADGALWMPILEKAVAKLYGNYERLLGSSTAEALQTLSAAPYEELEHTKEEDSTKELLAWIKERLTWGCRLTSRKESNGESSDASGVIDSYDYTIESIFDKDGKPHVKLIDHRARCGQNIAETGVPIVVSFEDYQKDYKTTKAYFDVDKHTHNHYAVYDVDTPKVNDNAKDYDNLVYEKITITSDVSQYLYPSVYTHSAQNFKNTGCWDEQVSTSKQLWAKNNAQGGWIEFGQKNYVHLPYVWIEEGSSIKVDVAVYWPPEDYSPHDFSVVVWSEKQPVKFKSEKTHSNQPAKEFPLYTIDPDVPLYSLSGGLLVGYEPETCEGNDCGRIDYFGDDGRNKYEIRMNYVEAKWYIAIKLSEDSQIYQTMQVQVQLNDSGLDVAEYPVGEQSEFFHINYGSGTQQRRIDCESYEMLVSVNSDNLSKWYNAYSWSGDYDDNVMSIDFQLKPTENHIGEPISWRADWTYGRTIRVRSDRRDIKTTIWKYYVPRPRLLSLSSTSSLLALESENTAEADTLEKHVSIGVIASVGSVIAASFFACVFMAKGKNAVNDDFERV